jgi:uncharacterized protein (TIGR03118 family)
MPSSKGRTVMMKGVASCSDKSLGLLAALSAVGLLAAGCSGDKRYFYVALDRVDIVSTSGDSAEHIDPNLANPVGLQLSPNGNLWIANNRTGTLTAYAADGTPLPAAEPRVIQLPVPPALVGTTSRPTGLAYYGGRKLTIASGEVRDSARYLLATEEGTILGYNAMVDPARAIIAVDNSATGAVYRGLAIASSRTGPLLYASNFSAGRIDVFDESFAPATDLAPAAFEDQELPADFAPFGIQRIDAALFVTYAARGSDGRSVAAGGGYVDVFALDGRFVRRLVSGDPLNAPWGVTFTPYSFPYYAPAVFVGNQGDGQINAFDPWTGAFIGGLDTDDGPLVVDGLWDLAFAPNADGDPILTFTAGDIAGQSGFVGTLSPHLVRSDPPESRGEP